MGSMVAMGFTGDDVLCPKAKEETLCGGGGVGEDLVCEDCQGFGEGRLLTSEVLTGLACVCADQLFPGGGGELFTEGCEKLLTGC